MTPTIADQLTELQNGPESDDYGCLRPTQYACDATLALLRDCKDIPSGCVSTDAEGGVRIEWVREAGSVHLVVPPVALLSRPPYIYHAASDSFHAASGSFYATDDATPEGLAYWLKKIAAEPSGTPE